MLDERTSPAQCATMREVRFGVDRLDEAIVALIGERFRYMDAAARNKPERGAGRGEDRKAEVVGNVRRRAAVHEVPEAAIAELYERLIEASIAYELDRFDALRR